MKSAGIKRLAKRMRIRAGAATHDRILADAEAALGRSAKDGFKVLPPRPLILRIIMLRPIVKLVAAAVILVGLALLIHSGNGSVDIATPAFAQMIEAMGRMPWVHTIDYVRSTELRPRKSEGVYECWYSQGSKTIFSRSAEGTVSCRDYPNRTETVYHPDSGTVLIAYLAGSFEDAYLRTMTGGVDALLKSFKQRGHEVECEKGQYEGIDVDIYYLVDYRTEQGKRFLWSKWKLVVDRDKRLPIASDSKFWSSSGKLFDDIATRYDYPESGPRDIYELGAPRSARVLDYSPTPELLRAVKAYESSRDSFPTPYTATMVYTKHDGSSESKAVDRVVVFCCDGIVNKRLEALTFDSLPPKELPVEWDDFAKLLLDVRMGKTESKLDIRSEEIVLYDGKHRYSMQREDGDASWSSVQKVYLPSTARRLQMGGFRCDRGIVCELGWPIELLESTDVRTTTSIVADDYSKENNLICIEVHHAPLPREWRFYLNPQRDYICQRQEIYRQYGHDYKRYLSIKEVLKYGQTDDGRWYPQQVLEQAKLERRDGSIGPEKTNITLWLSNKKVLGRSISEEDKGYDEESQTMLAVYLDVNPEFPEGLFDPEKLPKAAE